MAEDGNKKREAEGREKLAYSRSCSGMSDPHSEVAPLCSWMVCSSSDSEGRSLKVLSSRPGASREKRRTRWGRGVAASGSAVLAGVPGWQGPSAPVESVTTGFVEMQPLFWFASASPSPKTSSCGSASPVSEVFSVSLGSGVLLSVGDSLFPRCWPMLQTETLSGQSVPNSSKAQPCTGCNQLPVFFRSSVVVNNINLFPLRGSLLPWSHSSLSIFFKK